MSNTTTLEDFPLTASLNPLDRIYMSQNDSEIAGTVQQIAKFSKNYTVKSNYGDPNGVLAGEINQLCWDTQHAILFICTHTGDPSTTIWSEVFNADVSFGINQIILTTSGIYTKPSNLVYLQIESVGAGGGSAGTSISVSGEGNVGGAGGGGAYSKILLPAASLSTTTNYTIGIGGDGGILNNDGSDGGDTSFGTLSIAGGGKHGVTGVSSSSAFIRSGGSGGTATAGDILVNGGCATNGIYLGINTSEAIIAGNGGDSAYGRGGIGASESVPTGFGGGGTGTSTISLASNGINGGNGVIILTEYLLV